MIEESEQERQKKQKELDDVFRDVMSYDSDFECQKPKKKESK